MSFRRSLALFALIVFIVPLSAAAPQDNDIENSKNFPVKLKGKRYQIWSTTDNKKAMAMLKHMELVFNTYGKLLGLARAPSKKMTIVLFKDREEYVKFGSPGGSVAYYDGERLVGYYNEKTMYNYFAHEGFHQFTDAGLKAIDKAGPWFTEGMAECIGNSVVRKKKLYMCVKDGVIATENITTIRRMIKENTHTSFENMLSMTYERFMGTRGMYPESWAICHFLMAYPNYEDPKGIQIPNGQYWKILSRFITLMSKGKMTNDQAVKASFVDKRGKPLDFAKLEKEWKEYILNWPIRGEDEEDEDIPEAVLKKIKEAEKKKAEEDKKKKKKRK